MCLSVVFAFALSGGLYVLPKIRQRQCAILAESALEFPPASAKIELVQIVGMEFNYGRPAHSESVGALIKAGRG